MTEAERRVIEAARAAALAREEYQRQWKLNGESEKQRNERGELLDGQLSPATLAAVRESNIAYDSLREAASQFLAAERAAATEAA